MDSADTDQAAVELASAPPLKRQKCMVSQCYFTLRPDHAAQTKLTIELWHTKLMAHFAKHLRKPSVGRTKAAVLASRLTMAAMKIELLLDALERFVQPNNDRPILVEYQTFNYTVGCGLLFDTTEPWHANTGQEMMAAIKRAWSTLIRYESYTEYGLGTEEAMGRLSDLITEAVAVEQEMQNDNTTCTNILICKDAKVWITMQCVRAREFIRKSPHSKDLTKMLPSRAYIEEILA
jgi:hypothetical protein